MSSEQFIALIINFVKNPNQENKDKLSERLYVIVNSCYQKNFEIKEKDSKDNIEISKDDYSFSIFQKFFNLCENDLYLSNKKIKLITAHAIKIFDQIHKKSKHSETNKKLSYTYYGWHCLIHFLYQIKEVSPLYKSLKSNIRLLRKERKNLSSEESKEVILNLIKKLKNSSKEYIIDSYFLCNDPNETMEIYKEKVKQAINEALPVIQKQSDITKTLKLTLESINQLILASKENDNNSIKNISLSYLVKKYLNTPNENNKENLSEKIISIVADSINTKNIIDIFDSENNNDYYPYIYYNFYKSIGKKIGLNQNKLSKIENISNDEFNKISQIIIEKQKKEINEVDQKNLEKTFTEIITDKKSQSAIAWHVLSHALQNINKLMPLLKRHQELEKDINSLLIHTKKLKNREAKKAAEVLIQELKIYSREYLGKVYFLHDNPDKVNTIKEETDKYKKNIANAINNALPILEQHRLNKTLRIINKIILTISAVCTAGLALVPKAIHSKITTNKFTFFRDITQSHGRTNSIQKSVKKLTSTVTQVCAKENR